jgi:hypothetical protein
MSDPYLAIAAIANDEHMIERLRACATQQAHLGGTSLVINGPGGSDPVDWVGMNRYLWAASPSWGEKWQYALDSNPDDPNYEPGKDTAVITDADILATVQGLTGLPEG